MIEAALSAAQAAELRQANLAAIPASLGFTYLLKQGGAKHAKPSWINPYPREIERQHLARIVDPVAARIFLRLLKEGKVPTWVTRQVDPEKIREVVD